MYEQPTKRSFLKGLAATGAAVSLGLPLATLGQVNATSAGYTRQGFAPLPHKTAYVFASDPRAGDPAFQVMPG